MTEKGIILVGGSGRSGTTVLNKVLEQHPMTTVSPPLRYMIDPDGVLEFMRGLDRGWSPYGADIRLKRLKKLLGDVAKPALLSRFIDQIGLRKKLSHSSRYHLLPKYGHLNAQGYCPEFARFADDLIKELTAFSYRASWVGTKFLEPHEMGYFKPTDQDKALEAVRRFFLGIVETSLERHQARIYVDRNTWNHIWLEEFLKIDPTIKLLHIYRDPRDVVASYMAQNWMPRTCQQAAQIYQDLMTKWWEVRKRVPKESYFEVSLEELSGEPEGTLHKICEFMNVEFHPDLLNISLNGANAGRWQKDIDIAEHGEMNKILQPSLEAYGYEGA
ncbi:sulfotransferase family protein [Candidatus Terasakiella magnetica]|nr:sulfotransferase [Candidatus Terasakiella magnetica]